MAARLPAAFDNQDEQLDAFVVNLQQRIQTKIDSVVRLPQAALDQKAQMDGLLALTAQPDKADERTAYRGKLRRMWNKFARPKLVEFIQLEAAEQRASGTTAQFLKEILTDIATLESKTLADYLTEIGNAT